MTHREVKEEYKKTVKNINETFPLIIKYSVQQSTLNMAIIQHHESQSPTPIPMLIVSLQSIIS